MKTNKEQHNNNTFQLYTVLKASLQALLSLHNLSGNQAAAFRVSRQLCSVLSDEFSVNQYSRRTKNS